MWRDTIICSTPEFVGEDGINPDVEVDVAVTISVTANIGYGFTEPETIKVESIRRVSDGAEILEEVDIDEVWRLGQFAFYGEGDNW